MRHIFLNILEVPPILLNNQYLTYQRPIFFTALNRDLHPKGVFIFDGFEQSAANYHVYDGLEKVLTLFQFEKKVGEMDVFTA